MLLWIIEMSQPMQEWVMLESRLAVGGAIFISLLGETAPAAWKFIFIFFVNVGGSA